MGKKVSRWIADDGTEFNDQVFMIQHELAVLDEKEIDIFLANTEKTPRQQQIYKKILVEWQKHMRSIQMPTPIQSDDTLSDISTHMVDTLLDAPAEEWVPPGGYQLDEEDEEAAIQRSFRQASKI